MSDLAYKLTEAIDAKQNDINRWIWVNSNKTEIRMMDMNYALLQQAYTHVLDMLYNKDIYHPGVYRKKDQIRKMWDNANAELLHRYVLHDCNIDTLKTSRDLLDFINAQKQINGVFNSDSVVTIFNGLPDVFTTVTIDKLLAACLDSLEAFNRRLISDKFILSLGIWLTESEKKELTEFDESGKMRNRKDVIKERLLLNPNVELRFVPTGLSYYEFRSLVKIEGRPKFSSFPTDTLKLLRDKALLLLDQDLEYHVNKWEDLKYKLEKVAEQKGFTLKTKEY